MIFKKLVLRLIFVHPWKIWFVKKFVRRIRQRKKRRQVENIKKIQKIES